MRDFKFFTDNDRPRMVPMPLYPTMEDIQCALEHGRQSFLAGLDINDNPYLNPQRLEAFIQGWRMEESYSLMRQSFQIESNEL